MSNDLPVAVWSGSFTLFGVEIKCHTLDNGQRIIEADSMAELFRVMEEGGSDVETDLTEAERFGRWRSGQ